MDMLKSLLFKHRFPSMRMQVSSATAPSQGTSFSDAPDEMWIILTLSPPRIVAVTTVDAMVALVTLVGTLDMLVPVSPRIARVEMP